jgi:CPA2 family monovalent cation:H+ antiporter-2
VPAANKVDQQGSRETPVGDLIMHDAFVLVVSALVVVIVLHRLRASPVLGYLVAGVVVGPSVLGLIGRSAEITTFADLGVVFLLFLVGLELSFERLRTMRRLVFGLGGAQVAVTALAVGLVAWLWGNAPPVALLLGVALALSSTAVVIQLLVERGEMASRVGRTSFSILLFQDLVVVPLLVLVPFALACCSARAASFCSSS